MLKHFEIPFEEKLVALDQPNTAAEIAKFSAAGKVPVLVDGKITVWESLAIGEYLAEKFPELKLWPTDVASRAVARAIAHEMHAGFAALREQMSHDLCKQIVLPPTLAAAREIARIENIWAEALIASGGPYLFGREFSIADAMYAPVVNRFVSYGVKVRPSSAQYMATIRELPAHKAWIAAALTEELRMPRYE